MTNRPAYERLIADLYAVIAQPNWNHDDYWRLAGEAARLVRGNGDGSHPDEVEARAVQGVLAGAILFKLLPALSRP